MKRTAAGDVIYINVSRFPFIGPKGVALAMFIFVAVSTAAFIVIANPWK